MSKKEELLIYVEENLDNSCNLLLETNLEETNEKCTLTIGATKARTAQIITENFSEELVGNLPNDRVIHRIENWTKINKPS